jgi:mannosidase alpha-like ER degradation enhancer 2
MTALELSELRESTVKLFKHAFGSYMAHAFPMDELLPLSCRGIDSFGGVSVTLIDSLDTLAVMGLRQEFAEAVEVFSKPCFVFCVLHRVGHCSVVLCP